MAKDVKNLGCRKFNFQLTISCQVSDQINSSKNCHEKKENEVYFLAHLNF
jgi:hypothetical protein